MKHLFSITVLSFICAFSLHGQDTIVTKEGNRLEADIVRVTEQLIQYRRPSLQNETIFEMDIVRIDSILWRDGSVDRYIHTAKTTPPSQQQSTEEAYLPYIEKLQPNTFQLHSDPPILLNRVGYQAYLIEHGLEHVWERYDNGRYKVRTAIILAGCSGAFAIAGAILITRAGILSFSPDETYFFMGSLLTLAGSACAAASVPMFIVGGIRMASAMRNYNAKYARKPHQETSLHIGFTGNGMGFALKF
jgi:hypothetical protein